MVVLRPADANETVAAWRVAIGRKQGPVALVLTRQSLPVLDLNSYPAIPTGVPLGGYILADSPTSGRPDIVLIATGSEVQLALDGRERLAAGGVKRECEHAEHKPVRSAIGRLQGEDSAHGCANPGH